MKLLIAALVLLLLALIAFAIWLYNYWKTAQQKKAALGTFSNGLTPAQASIVDRWSTAPQTVTAGTDTTFVFTVQTNQVSGLLPVKNRVYMMAVPSNITVVSINGTQPSTSLGTTFPVSTTTNGTITIVINADPVEQPTAGAISAQQVSADQSTADSATFTIQ